MDVIAAVSGAIVAAAAFAVLTLVGAGDAKVSQRVHALNGAQIHAAAQAAAAAVRTTERNEFLTPEAHTAAATVARLHVEFGFVDEFHGGSLRCAAKRTLKRGPTEAPFKDSNAEPLRARRLLRDDVDEGVLLGAFDAKLNHAMGLGKERVIGADTDVHTGAIYRAALPNQNVAGQNILAAELLDAQTLGVRIAAVASTAAGFFVCHVCFSRPLCDDRGDLDIGIRLPMGLLALVVLAAAEFDNANLGALAMTFHGRNYFGGADVGGADGHGGPCTDQQDLIEFDASALVGVEFLDTHHGTLLNAVLFTARGDYGVHCWNSEGGQ